MTGRPRRTVARAVVAVVCGVSGLAVADSTWTGGTSQEWNTAGNWSNGLPGGTNAFVNTATGNYPVFSGSPAFTPVDLFIGVNGGTGRMDATAGTLATSGWMFVGVSGGNGTFNLANTATTGGSLTGYGQGSGSLTVGNSANGNFYIGSPGYYGANTSSGTFNMNTSGTLAANYMAVGELTNTTGNFRLDTGTVNVGYQLRIGVFGTGTFGQSGGTVNTSDHLIVGGPNDDGTGTAGGTGTYNQTGGTVNAGNEMWIGNRGTGAVNVSGGSFNSNSWLAIGRRATGTLTVTGGTVNAAKTNASSFVTIGSFAGANGTLNVSGGAFTTTRVIYAGEGGTGTVTVSGTGSVTTSDTTGGLQVGRSAGSVGTVNLNGGSITAPLVTRGSGTGTFNFNGGTLKPSQSTTSFMTGLSAANVRNGGAVFNTDGFNVTVGQILQHSAIGGDNATDGGLTKNGTGALTLNAANTFTGNVLVNAGTLTASFDTLNAGVATQPVGAFGNKQTAGKTVTVNGGGTVLLSVGNVLGSGDTTLATAPALKFVVNAGGTLRTSAGDRSGGGGGDSNVFGPIDLNGGTLTVGNGYSSTYYAAILLGTVTAGGSSASTIDKISTNGFGDGVQLGDSAAGTDTITFNVADATSNANTDLAISARIANSPGSAGGLGALNKTGPGTLLLSGANSYSGGTTIAAGTVSIGNDGNLGASASPVTLNGGTLTTTAYVDNTHPVTVGPGGGTINVTTNQQFFVNVANTLLGSGPLTVTGNGTLTPGIGNLRIDKTNAYSGTMTATTGGIIEYGTAGAVSTGAAFTIGNQGELAVQGNVATSLPNAITVSGGTNSVLSFENGPGGNVTGGVTLNANLTVGLRDWYGNSTARSGTISGTVSGSGGLIVSNGTGTGGTLTLSGNNTYAGNTTVNGGTVRASASRSPTSGTLTSSSTGLGTVVVANGGTLAGDGGTGDVSVNTGGTITAGSGATTGDSVGTLNTGRQTWNPSGKFVIKKSATANDRQNVTGLLSLSSLSNSNKFILNVLDTVTGAFTPGVYKIATASTGVSTNGSAAVAAGTDLTSLFVLNVNGVGVANGDYRVTAGLFGGGGDFHELNLSYSPTPEPGVVFLVGLAAAPLLGRRKRRESSIV